MRAEVVLDSLEMANDLRRRQAGLIALRSRRAIHQPDLTDRSTSPRSLRPLASRATPYNNAMAKEWVATFKRELVD